MAPLRAAGGEVSGAVTDESGAPVAGAQVRLLRADRTVAASAVSDLSGHFLFADVLPNTYSLQVNASAFSPSQQAIRVRDDEETTVSVQLSVQPVVSEVTVTADTGSVAEVDALSQRVNVVSQETLERRASSAVVDALSEEVGVSVQHTVPVMGGVSVRGLLGKNVAVYRDGVRYTTSAQRGGVSTFLNLSEPTNLEAAEVLRGPNSAQYSSDSMGGTVHFLSKVPAIGGATGWNGEFVPTYSSAANVFGGNLLASYGAERFGALFNLASRRVNTLRPAGGVDSHAAVTRFLGLPSDIFGTRLTDTAFTQYGGMSHFQFAPTPRQQVVGHYERSQQDGGKRWDQLLGGDGNLIANLRNLMLDFGYLRYNHFAAHPFDQFSVTFSYNTQREERVNQGGNGDPLEDIRHQYERTKVWGTNFYGSKQLRGHNLLIGGDGYHERITSPAFTVDPVAGVSTLTRPRIPDRARYLLYGLYLQDVWEPISSKRFRISGALRFGGASYLSRASNSPLVSGAPLWPDDSTAASSLSGRLGVVWRATDFLQFRANYSRGFRMPAMTDLGSVGIQGNGFFEASFADLASSGATIGDRADELAVSTGRPVQRVAAETSDNYETGILITSSRMKLEFDGFWMNLNDTIVSQTLTLPPGAVGTSIGDQIITDQLDTGAVFVPAATAPVQIRGNLGAAQIYGVEHELELQLPRGWSFSENATWIYGLDAETRLAPDIEGGIPPLTANLRLRWAPAGRSFWIEAYSTLADRQDRLSSLSLADRRTGGTRSRTNIERFFERGATVHGLVAGGILIPSGETLEQVQNRVLGSSSSAPLFTAIPGYVLFGLRAGFRVSERSDLGLDFSNIFDQSHRGVSWGVDGPGRGVMVRYRYKF